MFGFQTPFFSYENQPSRVQSKQAMNWIVGEVIQAMVQRVHRNKNNSFRMELNPLSTAWVESEIQAYL